MEQLPRTINIAITGALSEPRAKVAARINATSNGRFTDNLNLETHYLVCEKHDSKKARKAALYGTAIISEAELRGFLDLGEIPSVELPKFTPHHPNNFPTIAWSEVWDPARVYLLTYSDANGNISMRTVAATGRGGDGTYEWMAAYDGPTFKTFRSDRILSLEMLKK